MHRQPWMYLAAVAVAVACAGPTARVQFHALPGAVHSHEPASCQLLSRSPDRHILRVALWLEVDGQPVRPDHEQLRVAIVNQSRSTALANLDLQPDATPREVMLDGRVKRGDVLELSGRFAYQGKREAFEATCHVD